MKHIITKSELVKTLGKKSKIKENKKGNGKQIKLTEKQFTRLLETYGDPKEMDEVFGDGDLQLSDPQAQSMVTQSADDYYMDTESPSELDEDLNDFLGNMNEKDEGEEDLDEMWGTLAKMAASAAGAAAVDKLSDKYLEEKDDMMESIKKTYQLIRERIKIERPKGVKLMEYNSKTLKKAFLNEAQDEWRGKNPGVSAAAGIENIINSIKKGYDFIKDSRTRKQIENTLTKINNFMTYTAELVGSGRDQRGPRSWEQVASPLPYPELEQSAEDEAFEDIDDEINITEAYARIGVHSRDIPKQYKRRGTLNEQTLSYEITAPKHVYQGLGAEGCDYVKFFKRQKQPYGENISVYRVGCPVHEEMFDSVLGWADWSYGGFGKSDNSKKILKQIQAQMAKDKARFTKEKQDGLYYSDLLSAGLINHDGTAGPNSEEGKVAAYEETRTKHDEAFPYIAAGIYKAVKGLGTDEDAIYYNLNKLKKMSQESGRTVADLAKELSRIYAQNHGESLMDALKGDLSGSELTKAIGLLNEVQGINPERIAKELYDAMDGLGTDEAKFFRAIQPTGRQPLTPDEQKSVRDSFRNLYDDDLCEWIDDDFGGRKKVRALKAVGC